MNTRDLVLVLGVGGLLYWLYRQGKAQAATPNAPPPNPWAITLPPIATFPTCPPGTYYEPSLNACMPAPGALSP